MTNALSATASCAQRNQQTLGAGDVEQLAARKLAQQAGKATDAQDKADVLLAPSSNREQHGDERAKPGLHAREKEVEPVQAHSDWCRMAIPQTRRMVP